MYRILLTVVGTMTLLSGIVGYAGELPTPAGEVSFSGTVAAPASGGGVTWGIDRGPNEISLANEHGVTVALSLKVPATTPDVSLTPSPTGVTVKLIQ
jgi:hypothetical protein